MLFSVSDIYDIYAFTRTEEPSWKNHPRQHCFYFLRHPVPYCGLQHERQAFCGVLQNHWLSGLLHDHYHVLHDDCPQF